MATLIRITRMIRITKEVMRAGILLIIMVVAGWGREMPVKHRK